MFPNRVSPADFERREDPQLLQQLSDPDYGARLERAIVFTVEAWDVNCPQHIQPRYTVEELGQNPALLAAVAAEA